MGGRCVCVFSYTVVNWQPLQVVLFQTCCCIVHSSYHHHVCNGMSIYGSIGLMCILYYKNGAH